MSSASHDEIADLIGDVDELLMERLVATGASFDRSLHDEELAAVATQARIAELLEQSARARRTRTLRRAA